MEVSPSFTLLLIVSTSILSISVYSFSSGSVSHSSKTRHRKLNKIESLVLIPFAIIYHLLVIKFFINFFSASVITKTISRSFEFISGHNSLLDFVLSFYSELNFCKVVQPAEFIFGIVLYYVLVVILFPYLIGRYIYKDIYFKSSYKNLVLIFEGSKLALNITEKKFLIPVLILTSFYTALFAILNDWQWTIVFISIFLVFNVKKLTSFFLIPLLVTLAVLFVFIIYLSELILFLCVATAHVCSLGLLMLIKDWISSSDIPEYLKDFDGSDYFYVVDATLTDGKMISGILRDFDYIGEQKNLESIVLENPVRWERFDKTEGQKDFLQRDIIKTSYYLKEKTIPGESFFIKTSSLVDMNTAKTPRNFTYFFSAAKPGVSDEFKTKFKKWFKERNQKYIFSNIDVYIPESLANNVKEIQELFHDKNKILGRFEVFIINDEKIIQFIKKTGLKQSKKYLIECDIEKCTFTSPYYEGKEKYSPLKKLFLGAKYGK